MTRKITRWDPGTHECRIMAECCGFQVGTSIAKTTSNQADGEARVPMALSGAGTQTGRGRLEAPPFRQHGIINKIEEQPVIPPPASAMAHGGTKTNALHRHTTPGSVTSAPPRLMWLR